MTLSTEVAVTFVNISDYCTKCEYKCHVWPIQLPQPTLYLCHHVYSIEQQSSQLLVALTSRVLHHSNLLACAAGYAPFFHPLQDSA
jgi:hypothetical protein